MGYVLEYVLLLCIIYCNKICISYQVIYDCQKTVVIMILRMWMYLTFNYTNWNGDYLCLTIINGFNTRGQNVQSKSFLFLPQVTEYSLYSLYTFISI